jgi:hypothetical protein
MFGVAPALQSATAGQAMGVGILVTVGLLFLLLGLGRVLSLLGL